MTETHLKQVSAAEVLFRTKAAARLQIVRLGRVLREGLKPGVCKSTHLQVWSNFHLRSISQKLVVLLTVWCLDSLKCFFKLCVPFKLFSLCVHIFRALQVPVPLVLAELAGLCQGTVTYPIFLCIASSRWKPVCAASCLLWSALLDWRSKSITLSDKVVRGCSSKQLTLGECKLCSVPQLHVGVWFVRADWGNRRHVSAQCFYCCGGRAAFCLRSQ